MGLGLFRVILAFTVIITHTHPVFGFTLGNPVIAVRSFFIVSGFYMALILNEKYSDYWMFIKNRFLRIYPIYLTVLVLTIISCLGAYFLRNNWGELDYYATYISRLNIFALISLVVAQITIFGRDILMFSSFDPSTGWFTFNSHVANLVPTWPFLLVPQAWTLPIELLFYLIAPFLVRRKFYFIALIFVATLIIRSILKKLGLDSTMWTYRFFPVELGYFVIGVLSYKLYSRLSPTAIVKNIGRVSIILMMLLLAGFNYMPGYLHLDIFTTEWLYYLMIAILLPFGFVYSKNLKFDRKFGDLSYPIYISHILVNNVANPLFISKYLPTGNFSALTVLLLSVILSIFILKYIQDPIEKIRKRNLVPCKS